MTDRQGYQTVLSRREKRLQKAEKGSVKSSRPPQELRWDGARTVFRNARVRELVLQNQQEQRRVPSEKVAERELWMFCLGSGSELKPEFHRGRPHVLWAAAGQLNESNPGLNRLPLVDVDTMVHYTPPLETTLVAGSDRTRFAILYEE